VAASLRKRRQPDADLIEFHTKQAQRYAERLGRSRGVLMKAGQMLSFVAMDPAVDAPYRGIYQAAFARLQDDAPPMPPQLATDTIRAELGRSPRDLFAQFEPIPLAAASIGQVHAATLHDGRRVAVKVQYPGVEAAIRADLKNTELIATFVQMVFTMVPGLARIDVREVAAEVATRIGEEIDYRIEARHQQEFADVYRGHPFIHIPEVLPEYSTRRVLTMELSDGVRYARALTADRALRDAWGEAIFRFVWGNLIQRQIFNTDPHPGNYLFHPDGSVTFLDFGCVKRFEPEAFHTLEAMTVAAIDQDADRLLRLGIEIGTVDVADPPDPDALLSFWSLAVQDLLRPQPFTYSTEFAAEILRSGASRHSPHWPLVRRMNMSVDAGFIFLSRIQTGMSAVLGGLGATCHWRAVRAEYDRGGPPATPFGEAEVAYRKAVR
jgi:predicted unusual protein kinase regulating ubiquinone biosynthesis (AarF/ABC1/UbiB family)